MCLRQNLQHLRLPSDPLLSVRFRGREHVCHHRPRDISICPNWNPGQRSAGFNGNPMWFLEGNKHTSWSKGRDRRPSAETVLSPQGCRGQLGHLQGGEECADRTPGPAPCRRGTSASSKGVLSCGLPGPVEQRVPVGRGPRAAARGMALREPGPPKPQRGDRSM